VLYEHNADKKMLIASTTKIMTAIIVIEKCSLDDKVAVKPSWCGAEGSSMYLRSGDSYTVRDLLTGMMLASGNDAAVALACYTAGSIGAFAGLMNKKAKELGMTSSAFKNPNGLDEQGHYSTARDMARLTDYCMRSAEFRQIVSCRSKTIGGKSYVNHNKLLWNCPGCIGVKTGYTKASGRSLVSCCERDGTRYICVTLGDPDDWTDHQALYDWAFGQYRELPVIDAGSAMSLPVVAGKETAVRIVPECSVRIFLPADAKITYRVELPRFVFAGVEAGEAAGRITALKNGTAIASARLLYAQSIPRTAGCGGFYPEYTLF
jgi:D-alanyl-D-alanine carboxypeptidase (penicillin-binding protein 5/6)